MWICNDCIRGIAFYTVFRDGFRDPELRGDVITVGIDIGNLVWLNPFASAWLYPILLWTFFRERGVRLHLEDLKLVWKYRSASLEEVLRLYIEEGIFKVIEEDGEHVIVEGDALNEMLKMYGDRPDLYEIIEAWVGGLLISRLHQEDDAPDFRYVFAAVKAIADNLTDSDGNIRGQPYVKTVSYRCRKCGAPFLTKEEARRHLIQRHRVPSGEVMAYIEEETMTVGYLLEIERLIETLRREGVRPERFWDRIERFGVLVHEDAETPRVVERNGSKYLVIDPAWVRIVARTRTRERELIRELERSR